MDRLVSFYGSRAFSLEGCVNYFSFIISLVILFYQIKKFKNYTAAKNAALIAANIAGLYAAMLVCSGLFALITDVDIILNYFPKFIVMVIYAAFFSGYKWQSKVILCAMLYTIHHCLIETGGCLSGVISSTETREWATYIRYLLTAFTVCVAIFLRFFNIDKNNRVPQSAVIEAVCYSIVGTSMAVFRSSIMQYFMDLEQTEYYLYSFYPQLYAMIALVCLMILIFFCYFFVVRNIHTNEKNAELNKKVMRLESNSEMIAVNESNLKMMRKLRHDINKSYSLIKVMLEKKQYDKLDSYFNELMENVNGPLSQVDTGNSFFDTVLNLEISKAKSKDIDVSTKLIVPPELPVSDLDLGGLITNLMDNAIEACEKISGGQKNISVMAQIVRDYFVLSVSNSVSSESAQNALLLKTDKQDKELHGIGSKIIDDIIKKYDGQINRRVEDNVFAVDIMLDISNPQNEGDE